MATGTATLLVTAGNNKVSFGTLNIQAVAPGLFAANANGQGAAAGLALRVRNPNPVPAISSLSPSSAVAGAAGFTLTVNGASFINGSVVRWNGADRATTFVSATQLRAAIPAADIASTGAAAVTVFNPEPGGGTSNASNFSINNPVPSIASMSHASTTSGGPGFTLTINGSNFIPTSVARWNGSDRATTVVSGSRLMAEITAADIAAAVDGSVTVFNPPPGGGTSASQRIFVFDGNLDVRLTSGVPVTGNFSGSPPGACGLRIFPQYTILVPDGASQLRIALTSNQDLDLFARFAQRVDIPSSIVADYSSRSSGGNETITVTPSSSPPLQAGKYFVLIANCSTSAATFSLTATVTGGAAADPSVIASDARPE
ncbi:MAG: IPT/TIG domain-containing protein, partial [Pseudomonadota bacterium]